MPAVLSAGLDGSPAVRPRKASSPGQDMQAMTSQDTPCRRPLRSTPEVTAALQCASERSQEPETAAAALRWPTCMLSKAYRA